MKMKMLTRPELLILHGGKRTVRHIEGGLKDKDQAFDIFMVSSKNFDPQETSPTWGPGRWKVVRIVEAADEGFTKAPNRNLNLSISATK